MRLISGLVFATLAACSDRPMTAAPDGGAEEVGAPAADAATMTATVPDAAADRATDLPKGRCDPPDAAPVLDVGSDLTGAETGSPSEQFRRIYETILRPSCGGAGRFCHANELLSTKLDFNTLEKAFANLVNVPMVTACVSVWPPIRVVPFDPKASAIMYARTDLCSYRHGTITYGVDLAPIEAWILAGAR